MKRMVSDAKSEKLAQELKDLEARGDDELKDRWRSLYGTNPPQKIHRSLLMAAVVHRMQENALGALKSSVRRHLIQAASNPATPRPSPHYPSLRPSDHLQARLDEDFEPVYFGDDLTDEDAFRELEGRGVMVMVGMRRSSATRYRVHNPSEVARVLKAMAAALIRLAVEPRHR